MKRNNKVIIPYDNIDFKKLSNFINDYLNDTIYYDIALNEVLKLVQFIEENLSSFSHSLLLDIVVDNQKLAHLLEIIINNFLDITKIEDTFDNEILVLLLNSYAMHKGLIEFNLDEYQDYDNDNYISSHLEKSKEEETNQLFGRFFPLVLEEAKFYAKDKESFNDLVEEGSIYLMEAISSYDSSKKIPFKVYASQIINGEFLKYVLSNGKYYDIPHNILLKISELRKIINDFEMHGINYDLNILAKKTHLSKEEVEKALSFSYDMLNYDDLVNSSELPYDLTSLSSPSFEEEVVNNPNILKILNNLDLSPKEKQVIYLKYFQNASLKDMKKELQISHSRIAQLFSRVSWRLLRCNASPSLTEYLDSPDFGLELISDARSTNYRGPSTPINCLCDPYFKDFSSLEKLLNAHPLEIKIILTNLSLDDVRFIHKVYGDNLNENNISKLSLLEQNHLYNHLYYKMLEILNDARKYIANLDEYDEQVLSIIDDSLDQTILSFLDLTLLQKYFNDDETEIIYFLLLKQKTLKEILDELNINKENVYIILTKFFKLTELVKKPLEEDKKRVLAR